MPKHSIAECLLGGCIPSIDKVDKMTQEELAQLKALLNKAQKALPGVEHFRVQKTSDGLVLVGTNVYILNGEYRDASLLPNGEIKKSTSLVY